MASNKYGFKNKIVTEKKFDKKTPIEPVTLAPFHSSQEEKIIETYEELKYFLQCQNPRALLFYKRIISREWHIEGLGAGLELFKLNLKSNQQS